MQTWILHVRVGRSRILFSPFADSTYTLTKTARVAADRTWDWLMNEYIPKHALTYTDAEGMRDLSCVAVMPLGTPLTNFRSLQYATYVRGILVAGE